MKLNSGFAKRPFSENGRTFFNNTRSAAILAAIFFTSITVMSAADTNAPASAASAKTVDQHKTTMTAKSSTTAKSQPAKKPEVKKTKKQLSGAELYAVNCNRCHPERDPSEYTAAQWKTMMLYMRVRANIPASQARAITKYLEDQAGQ